ncbi:YCF48-related protein, partial [Leptolyngbya sp. FACHB-36]|uniref:YCF48-related protein n=1 Tax=Leptolyngbya sp. FACHB-36 TaxID=2692808 RepID=UPI001A7E9937
MHLATKFFTRVVVLLAIVLVSAGCTKAYLPDLSFANPWRVVPTPTSANLSDVSFADERHGWVVGSGSTLLETTDGGETWQARTLELDQTYRLTSVDFKGDEGWIAGQPSILLHTTDAGRSWSRVPLSEKLPGAPNTVVALSTNSAEMTTDIGAIYRTSDGGRTWRALVAEAVGVIRNISRSPEGKYIAVSSRGNFYSTWRPGQAAWEPHNRNSSRRLQSMG